MPQNNVNGEILMGKIVPFLGVWIDSVEEQRQWRNTDEKNSAVFKRM